MDPSRLDIFGMLTARMSWLGARQQVLAKNVAHADTPEYQARDLQPLDFAAMLRQQTGRVGLAVTHAGHIPGGEGGGPTATEAKASRQSFEAIPSGNAVVLEEEMLKVARTTADYELMANLYEKHVGMIKTAIGHRR